MKENAESASDVRVAASAASADGASASLESFGYKQELKRSLSLFDLLIYGLVFIVPGAPIAVYGIVYNASAGMVPLIYLVGLVAMVFTALSYMMMSHAFPVAGSVYAYAGRSLGPVAGFVAGWAILLDYLLLPTLTFVAVAIAMHATWPFIPKPIWVVGMLAFATAINYFGIELTARMNFILLALQLVILAIFMIVGVAALMHHAGGAHLSLLPFYNPERFTPQIIFGGLSLAVLSFLGFDAISTLSEESAGGSRTIARATMLSLCLSAVLFVAQTYLASLFVLGHPAFAKGDAAEQAFYNIVTSIGGYWLKFLVAVPGVFFAGVAGSLTAQAATARLLYSMARDGKLPRPLAHVHGVRKVPERAIFLVAAVTLVLGLLLVNELELLTSMVSFGALVGFLLLHVSVMAHFLWRKKSRDWSRHLIVPLIGLVIIGYVLWNAEANAKIAGAAWMVAGAAVFLTLHFMGRSTSLPVE
ncbi:MAG: APC family permease [Proteobacteria bacterium]|nr:APC family permease [Pseudomonadota bacterium]